jgi:hypothetical protein
MKRRMIWLVRAAVLLAGAGALPGGCLAPPPPGDPRGWDHARWCGTVPASGYCIVPER